MRPALPFAEDVRAARAEVQACQDAQLLDQILKTAATALSILEVQLASGTPLPDDLPGEDVLERAMGLYPGLAELPALMPAGASEQVRLRARRQQLELVLGALQPALDAREEAAQRLHHLQHEQVHVLEQPEWAEVVADLRVIGDRRDRLALELAPLQNQLSMLEPVRDMLAAFHPTLQAELIDAARTEDPDGSIAWRVAIMAHQQLVGLANVIEQLGLVVRYPFEPMLPDQPHPRHRWRLRKEAGDVLAWMVDLDAQLDAQAAEIQARFDVLKAEHDAAEAELMEWMG